MQEVIEMFMIENSVGISRFLETYMEQNAGRPTRIGVFEPDSHGVTDYWLENGLPLDLVEFDQSDKHSTLRIAAGEYTHEFVDPLRISFHFTPGGDEDGLDVAEPGGRTFVIRFDAI
jgi:hypothetical protein